MQLNYSYDGGTEDVHLSTSVRTKKENAIIINDHKLLQPRNSYGSNTSHYGSTDSAVSMQNNGKADQMPVKNQEENLTQDHAFPHAGSKCLIFKPSFNTTQNLMIQIPIEEVISRVCAVCVRVCVATYTSNKFPTISYFMYQIIKYN